MIEGRNIVLEIGGILSEKAGAQKEVKLARDTKNNQKEFSGYARNKRKTKKV